MLAEALPDIGGPEADPLPRLDPFRLAVGEAHPSAATLVSRLGWPLTLEGVAPVYSEVVPGTTAVVDLRLPDPAPEVLLSVTLRDQRAEEVASLLTTLRRRPKGLELEKSLVWVQPEHRGRGISDALTLAEIGLLRGLSGHPDTRLRLVADGAAGPDGTRECIGPYSWARLGLLEFEGDEDLARLREAWEAWLQRTRPPDADRLRAVASGWTRPSDVAAVGKAFLLSEEAVPWHGEFHVNRPLNASALAALRRLSPRAEGEGRGPTPEEMLERLPRIFMNGTRAEGTRLRALMDWYALGGRPETGALERLWEGSSDALCRAAFRIARASGSRGLATRAARRLLARPLQDPDGRAARLDALRTLAEGGARPEELARLEASATDEALRQAAADWRRALETGHREGAATP